MYTAVIYTGTLYLQRPYLRTRYSRRYGHQTFNNRFFICVSRSRVVWYRLANCYQYHASQLKLTHTHFLLIPYLSHHFQLVRNHTACLLQSGTRRVYYYHIRAKQFGDLCVWHPPGGWRVFDRKVTPFAGDVEFLPLCGAILSFVSKVYTYLVPGIYTSERTVTIFEA